MFSEMKCYKTTNKWLIKLQITAKHKCFFLLEIVAGTVFVRFLDCNNHLKTFSKILNC